MYKQNKEVICEYVDLPTGEVSHNLTIISFPLLRCELTFASH